MTHPISLSFLRISAIGGAVSDTHRTMHDRSFPDPFLHVLQCVSATKKGPIWKYIEWLDREGMDAIKTVPFDDSLRICEQLTVISDSRAIR